MTEGLEGLDGVNPEWAAQAQRMMEKSQDKIANKEDIEGFISKADEISKLIEGLKDGSVDPESIRDPEDMCEGCYEVPFKPSNVPGAHLPEKPEEKEDDDKPESPRSAAIRRAREERWVPKEPTKPPMFMPKRGKDGGTDYSKWDEWGASQIAADPDDVANEKPPPEAQGFMDAIEKDANERAKKKKEAGKVSDKYKAEGNEAFKAGKFSKAAKKYTKAIEKSRDRPYLYTNRAQAYIKLENYEDALLDIDKALRLDERNVKALFHRAKVHRAQDDLAAAVEDYRLAVECDPKNAQCQQLLADAERDLGERRAEDAVMASRAEAEAPPTPPTPAGLGGGVAPLPARKKKAPAPAPANEGGEEGAAAGGGVAKDGGAEEEGAAGKAGGGNPELLKVDELVAKLAGDGAPAACERLAKRLEGDKGEAARTYLRASGGLPKAFALLSAEGQGAEFRLRGGLALLAAATKGDPGNERAARGGGAFAAAARLLAHADVGVARAAAAALEDVTASGADSREALGEAEGAAAAAVGLMASPDAVAGHHATGLFRNCCVSAGFRSQVAALEGGMGGAVAALAGKLGAALDLTRAAAAGALGNLAADPAFRGALLAPEGRAAVGLLALLTRDSGAQGLASADETVRSEAVERASAVLGCFTNATVDDDHAVLLAGQALSAGGLPLLLKLVEDPSASVAPRAMTVLSRCARDKPFLLALAKADATAVLARLTSSGDDTVVEAAVRLLASTSRAESSRQVLATSEELLERLVAMVRQATSSVSGRRTKEQGAALAGNAALCLSEVARCDGAPRALRRIGAIPPLVDAMAGAAGVPPKKNAAICLARMAQEPKSLERLRELQGIQMMHVLLNG